MKYKASYLVKIVTNNSRKGVFINLQVSDFNDV